MSDLRIEPFDTATQILSEFGWIHTWSREHPGLLGRAASVYIDPVMAADGKEEVAAVFSWMDFLGQKVYPIGQVDGEGNVLLVAEDGKIYMHGSMIPGRDSFIAENMDEAWDKLLFWNQAFPDIDHRVKSNAPILENK